MLIKVRQAKHGRWGESHRNWVVTEDILTGAEPVAPWNFRLHSTIRTYTCTNWTDAMRIADDLANGWTIDPWRVIALSERRV